MGRKSTKENKSVYQEARDSLGWSREKAADEILKIDQGKYNYLDKYKLVKIEEESIRIHPEDIVALSKAYNMPELRNYYCCHQCEIGEKDVPQVTYSKGIHEILVNMAVTLRNVNHNKIRLMEILSDETISEDERDDFDKIYEELEYVAATVEALQLWCEKMKLRSDS
ncbi:MAG: XRE family transcriptional regulator [Lachnospiraceae bacterium]|nr:XRE family transcriptional regulator [Lachnospiraceae bacterium]